MGKKTLDRGRYYALVYGDPDVKYYQDGIFFYGNGTAMSSKDAPMPQPEEVAPEEQDERTAKLEAMHVMKLKNLAVKLGEQTGTEPPLKGKGLKTKLVKYILSNTE